MWIAMQMHSSIIKYSPTTTTTTTPTLYVRFIASWAAPAIAAAMTTVSVALNFLQAIIW